mgnify:CR=1 FL=1
MDITEKMQNAFNKQINNELFSEYLYLSLASFFAEKNLNGFANWFKLQAQEEHAHAMKLYDYVIDRDGKVLLESIPAPPNSWPNELDAVEKVVEHEKKVTKMIDELFNLAKIEHDSASEVFLHWFVTEQVEEEASAKDTLDKTRMVSDSKHGIFILDRELANRK